MHVATSILLSAVLVGLGVGPKHTEPPAQPKARWTQQIEAGESVEFKLLVRQGGTAKFAVLGQGNGDLNVRVYDEAGQEVAADADLGDMCVVTWTAKATQTFRIVVNNPAVIPNKAQFGHNLWIGC